jgi:energy-coupling factor transport system substrate-specific component
MIRKGKATIKDIALVAVWAALTFAAKLVLAPVANVELVSLLLAVFTVVMGLERGVCTALVFATLSVVESTYYGAGDWIVLYYINWPLLTLLAKIFLSKTSGEIRAAVLLGLFGLLFDVPSAGIKLALFGPVYAATYFVSGIPFDVMHGAANFVTALFLYRPLVRQLEKARQHMER